jgi:hypothetical protein
LREYNIRIDVLSSTKKKPNCNVWVTNAN